MWWMCNPPGVTLPGHHFTSARIMRVLKRMNANESRKPTSTRNAAWLPDWITWSR